MLNYVLRRLALMVPTLLGILLVSFVIIQFVPGGPVEQLVHQLQGASQGGEGGGAPAASGYRGRQGLDKEQIAEIEAFYAETDKNGEFSFRALKPGLWYLSSEVEQAPKDPKVCDKVVDEFTLSFNVK